MNFHQIVRSPCQYRLIPEKQFAAIAKRNSASPSVVGAYRAGSNPEEVLQKNSLGRTIVHIDLDYFINDFNGASRGAAYIPDRKLRIKAEDKLKYFFDALINANIRVDRWIVATSPGFCSAYHWEWLLSSVGQNVKEFEECHPCDASSRRSHF